MSWKYAVFSVMCPEHDPKETAALAAAVGLDGIEWRVTKKAPEPIEEVSYWQGNRSTIDIENVEADLTNAKALADEHQLSLPALGTYMQCHELSVVESAMRAAAAVGCPKLRVNIPDYDGSRPYQELFDETRSNFEKVAELAHSHGVQACIEMHMGNITPSAGLAYRLVSNFDPAEVGVIFDPGNMVIEGFENYQLGLELLGPYLSHVHVKNALWVQTGEDEGVATWEWRMAPVKKGQANWETIVAALKKVNYDGWLSFEDFSDGDAKAKLSEGLAYMKKLETAVG